MADLSLDKTEELLRALADYIRRYPADTREHRDVVLNVAAMVEHLEPEVIR